MSKLVRAFEDHLRAAGKSPRTVTKYLRVIDHFVETYGNPLYVSKETLATWRKNVMTKEDGEEAKGSTINIKVAALRSFLEYLEEERDAKLPDFRRILRHASVRMTPPKYLPDEERMKLFATAEADRSTYKGRQTYALLCTLFGTGLRDTATACLELRHLINETQILTTDKGQVTEPSIFPRQAYVVVRDLILERHPEYKGDPDKNLFKIKEKYPSTPFFIRDNGKPLSSLRDPANYVWLRVKEVAKKAGLKNVYPHRLRHSFATTLLDEKVPIDVVQMLMKHRDPRMTMRYRGLTPKAQNIALSNHPLHKEMP